MLKYTRKKYREIRVPVDKATDVLYTKMHVYDKEAKEILSFLIEQIKKQNANSSALKSMYQLMQKADDIAIDCAHKLAPYQDAKLATIEVRNKIEHRFVLRAPKQIESVESWMKQTGAEKLRSDQINPIKQQFAPTEPSLHDYDEEEDIKETNKQLLN
jgi:hypothetical protein